MYSYNQIIACAYILLYYVLFTFLSTFPPLPPLPEACYRQNVTGSSSTYHVNWRDTEWTSTRYWWVGIKWNTSNIIITQCVCIGH